MKIGFLKFKDEDQAIRLAWWHDRIMNILCIITPITIALYFFGVISYTAELQICGNILLVLVVITAIRASIWEFVAKETEKEAEKMEAAAEEMGRAIDEACETLNKFRMKNGN